MTQMIFSFEEVEALAQGRFTHPHLFVRCKMEAVLLKAANLPHQMICQLCGICGNTLRSYLADMLIPLTQVRSGICFGHGSTHISEDSARVPRAFCYGECLFELFLGKPVAAFQTLLGLASERNHVPLKSMVQPESKV